MIFRKLLLVAIGSVCLAAGTAGIVLPVIPTVPFFLVTLVCFAKSSRRLHRWFVSTGLYKKHLESFVQKKGMSVKTKAAVVCAVTLLMGAGFLMMKNVPAGRIALAIVWIIHVIYFVFIVPAAEKNADNGAEKTENTGNSEILQS